MTALVPADASGAFKLAEMMATGKLVPAHLQRSPGDCLMVIEQAMRWGMSPFAVAQCTSVIQGKLMFEGKLVAAALQSSGILDGRLDYEFKGEGDARKIIVRGKLKGGETKEIELALKDARTNNQMWTKQPEQQLVYAGTRVWGRRWAPEVMLGVYAPEEMEPEQPRDTFSGVTIDAKAEPVSETRHEQPPPKPELSPQEAARAFTDGLLGDIASANDENDLHNLAGSAALQKKRDRLKLGYPEMDQEIAQAFTKRFNDFIVPAGAEAAE